MGDYLEFSPIVRQSHGLIIPAQSLGEVARELRLDRLLSQRQVSIYSSACDRSRLSRFERDKEFLEMQNWLALVKYFGEPVRWGRYEIKI